MLIIHNLSSFEDELAIFDSFLPRVYKYKHLLIIFDMAHGNLITLFIVNIADLSFFTYVVVVILGVFNTYEIY